MQQQQQLSWQSRCNADGAAHQLTVLPKVQPHTAPDAHTPTQRHEASSHLRAQLINLSSHSHTHTHSRYTHTGRATATATVSRVNAALAFPRCVPHGTTRRFTPSKSSRRSCAGAAVSEETHHTA